MRPASLLRLLTLCCPLLAVGCAAEIEDGASDGGRPGDIASGGDRGAPREDAAVDLGHVEIGPSDASVPSTDATRPPIDASAPTVDAAAPTPDASAGPKDASAKPADATARPADASAPPTTKLLHATTFLRFNSSWPSGNTHTFFSAKVGDAERNQILDDLAGDGYGCIYLYAANEGDYGGRSVLYASADKAQWRSWLSRMRAKGLSPILWMRADDSSGLNRWTAAQWRALYDAVVADLDDLIDAYVIGLEVDEYWDEATTKARVADLKARTRKSVGVHTTGISRIAFASTADAYYLQTGFNLSAAQVAQKVRDARRLLPGKTVICAEYHLEGQSSQARQLGDAAIAAGADGVGNGCTRAGLDALKQR